MKRIAILASMFLAAGFAIGEAVDKPADLPKPSPAQLAWQEAGMVTLFHMDPRISHQDKPQLGNIHNTHLGEEAARRYAEAFNPEKLDTDQWIRTSKELGATAAILVVKHEVGFCLWPSDANPYSVKMLKWRNGKGDILRDFVASCRKYGLKPGVFTTTRFDNRLGINNSVPMKGAKITREEYNHLVEAETKELMSRYGDLFELWLDGSARTPAQGGPDILPIFEKHQPKTSIFYHSDDRRDVRWGGNEEGMVGDPCWSTVANPGKMSWGTGSPDGKFWCPAMADAPLTRDWFWRRDGDRGLRSLDNLKQMYLHSVGRNATLVLGLTPNTDGLLPGTDVERCREFGKWIKDTFDGKPLAETSGEGCVLILKLKTPVTSAKSYVILKEDIRRGERVREYLLETEKAGKWSEIKRGTNIGHERIIPAELTDVTSLRLKITKSIAEPLVSSFCVH